MRWKYFVTILAQALVVLFLSSNVRCGMLSDVTKVVIDSRRVLDTPMTVRAFLARFDNPNSVWIQLWQPVEKNKYSLVWQYKARPSTSDGAEGVYETINLPERYYVEVKGTYVLGMANDVIPGPMSELYSERSGLIMSVQDRNVRGMPIREDTMFEFDDLNLPYYIPVCLCNFTGCAEYGKEGCQPKKADMTTGPAGDGNTVPDVKSVSSKDNSVLMTEEMIIGLITWNVLLTFIVFVVIMVLMWMCADMEKMRKNERSGKAKIVKSPSNQSASTASTTRKRYPSNSSLGSDTTRSRSTLPGSYDVTL